MSRPGYKTTKDGLLVPIVYTDQHNDYEVKVKECSYHGDMVHVIFAVEDGEFEVNMKKSEFVQLKTRDEILKKVARLAS